MSGTVVQFRARVPRHVVYGTELEWAQHVLNHWIRAAGRYGWFLVEPRPVPRRARKHAPERHQVERQPESCFTIGNRAVDDDGIFKLTMEFDGWELLSRRGELLVFDTLPDALASICPATVAA
jgi:hypothetical protein